MTKGLTSLADILGDGLKTLEERATAAEELGTRVRAVLTGPEREHVIAANEREGTLVVVMDSAAWCAQVRYAQDELLAKLNSRSATQFTKLRVRVGRRSTSSQRSTGDG
ncbi:MAG TPA: DciA family protein [Steroidobacteraceae bacterium]|nr:DciA family protein [Steroidobacteraceae bacterium]